MRNTSEKPRENQCKEWLGETLPKQRNSSRIDAQTVRNTSQKTRRIEDWGPNHAKHERKAEGESMQGMTWRNASETAEQQQDWCPNCTKHEPENCRTLPKERVKKLEGLRPKPCETRAKSRMGKSMKGMTWRNASETAEQQQDWCPNCTKHEPENCRTLPKERVKS